MSLPNRLTYALYLTVVASAIVGLTLSILGADAIGLIPVFDVGVLLFHPLYLVTIYTLSLIVAPWLAPLFPIKRDWQ